MVGDEAKGGGGDSRDFVLYSEPRGSALLSRGG